MDVADFVEDESYYAALSLPREATEDDVKKAYRTLAQSLHPDKHTDAAAKLHAQEAFAKLQEAYDVLSDPLKRQVYDVYGKEGLQAGLQLSTHVNNVDDLRKEWQDFKASQEQQKEDADVSYRSSLICRIDASRMVGGLRSLAYSAAEADFRGGADVPWPIFRSFSLQSSLGQNLSTSDYFQLQGHVAVRDQAGGASIVCGYRRVLTPHDTLDASVVLGLRSIFSMSISRQLSPFTSGSISSSYSVQDGLGLQFATTRQLLPSTAATFAWIVGPESSAGMSMAVTHRGKKYVAQGKIDVGSITALSCKVTYLLANLTSARMVLRLGMLGVDVELGLTRKFSQQSSATLSTIVGLQGVVLKLRYVRAGHVFECPVVITHNYSNWDLVIATVCLPPLLSMALYHALVRPLSKWAKRRHEQLLLEERQKQIAENRRKALGEQRLIAPVARRKMLVQTNSGGMVVLFAVYGLVEDFIDEALAEDRTTEGSLDKPWWDVTTAVQYLSSNGRVQFYPNVPKSGLMGFGDPAPGNGNKVLYVAFVHNQNMYELVVKDREGATLPAQGSSVISTSRMVRLQSFSVALQYPSAEPT